MSQPGTRVRTARHGRHRERTLEHSSLAAPRFIAAWKPLAFVGLLLLGHAAAIWSTRWPAAAAVGGPIAARPGVATERSTLRVGTFNIHAGKGADGALDIARSAAALRELDLDLIGLNEVIASSLFSPENQADELGQELSLAALFAPCERRYGRDWFGNGLLTRWPVPRWERTPLPATQERGHRAMLLAEVAWQGKTLQVLLTHIDRRRDRPSQLQSVADRFLMLPTPAILLGDLNATAADPQLQRMLSADDVQDPLSAAGFSGQERIDWILTRGLRVVGGGVVNRGASDHPACWAELALKVAD